MGHRQPTSFCRANSPAPRDEMQSTKTIAFLVAAIALLQAPHSANGFFLPALNNLLSSPISTSVSVNFLNASFGGMVVVDLSNATKTLTNLIGAGANLSALTNVSAAGIKFDLTALTNLLALPNSAAKSAQIAAAMQNATACLANIIAAAANMSAYCNASAPILAFDFLNATQVLLNFANTTITTKLNAGSAAVTPLLANLINAPASLSAFVNASAIQLLNNLAGINALATSTLTAAVNAQLAAYITASNTTLNAIVNATIQANAALNMSSALLGQQVGNYTAILNSLASAVTGLVVPGLSLLNPLVTAFVATSNTLLATSVNLLTSTGALVNGVLGGLGGLTLNFGVGLFGGK